MNNDKDVKLCPYMPYEKNSMPMFKGELPAKSTFFKDCAKELCMAYKDGECKRNNQEVS